MGQLFSQLTTPNSALINPQTSTPSFIGSPAQVLSKANTGLQESGLASNPNLGTNPLMPDLNITAKLAQKLPKIGTPSASQAAEHANQTGMGAFDPSLSKGGKLLFILQRGLQGALAGQAAVERSVALSGGRSRGGIGTGAMAGFTFPWQQRQEELQNQLGQGQLALQQGQLQMLPFLQQHEIQQADEESALRQARTANLQSETDARNTPKQTNPSLIQDTQGNVIGWKDGQGNIRPVTDPSTPPGISAVASAAQPRPVKQSDQDDYLDMVAKAKGKKDRTQLTPQESLAAIHDYKAAQKIVINNGARNVPVGSDIPLIDPKKEPNKFRIAQDLAYGRLNFSQLRSMYAYSRDTVAKQSLYATAQNLNPNFNPAAFEMGFQLAKNPRVQQQLASLDNVIQAAPDLIRISNDADRSGATVINKYTIPIKIAVGNQKFSNLRTAQVAFADELSGALGYGSATDMSREMGFNMTDPNLSPKNFAAAINDVVIPFVERKRRTLLSQMGIYGQPNMNPAANAPGNKQNDPMGIR